MSIKKDSLKILVILYNYKIKGISEVRSDDAEIINLKLSETEFNNAYEFLRGKKFAKVYCRLPPTKIRATTDFSNESKEKTKVELEDDAKYKYEENIKHMAIQIKGIDVIETDKKIRSIFGHDIIKKVGADRTVTIIDNSIHISNPQLNNVTHKNTGDINYGNIINKTVNVDNSTKYNIDKENVFFTEKMSISLINKYGEKKLTLIGTIDLIASFFTILVGLKEFVPTLFSSIWIIPSLPVGWGIYFLTIGISFFASGAFLLGLIEYKYNSKCKNCKEFYAIEEVGEPLQTEIETHNGYRINTIRHYKCKKCGYQQDKIINSFVEKKSTENYND